MKINMNLQQKSQNIANKIKEIIAEETKDIPIELLHTLHIGIEADANTFESEGLSGANVSITEHDDKAEDIIDSHQATIEFNLEEVIQEVSYER